MTNEILINHLLLLKEHTRGIEDTIIPNVKSENFIWIVDETIKALEQQPKWIPVSERLPEENTRCLVCTINGYIGTDKYGEHKGLVGLPREYRYKGWGSSNKKPIAWMPLPQPYREDSE